MPAQDLAFDFTTITLPGITNPPQLSGINDRGDIVGTLDEAGGEHGILLHQGQVTTIDVPGASFTSVSGINNPGDIVGNFTIGSETRSHGFLLHDGTFTTLDIPGATDTELGGINDQGQIVAFAPARDANAASGGFLFDGGEFSRITVPGSPDAFLVPHGINDRGEIVGDTGRGGFILDHGQLTPVDFPDAQFGTHAFGINNAGQVVGEALVARGVTEGFLFEDGQFTTIDFPHSAQFPPGTSLADINDQGEMVGNSVAGGIRTAFLATPAPPAAVDWDALAAQVEANFAATGTWFLEAGPPPPADLDWNALAAQVTANFEATGQWFA